MKLTKLSLVLILAIALELFITFWYYLEIGSDRFQFHLFRTFLVLVFSVMTYHEIRWAKWMLVGWFVFNSIIGFYKVQTQSFENSIVLGYSILYFIIPLLILFLPNNPHTSSSES